MRNPDVNADAKFNTVLMEGKYEIDVSDCSWEDSWIHLHDDLVSFYATNAQAICRRNGLGTTIITGYTRARCYDENGHQSIFYAHPCYRGSPWYDWAYVHFVDDNEDEAYYPAKILGFFGADGGVDAVVQCSLRPLNWSTLEKRMFVEFELEVNEASFVAVPLSSFVYTLCVIDHPVLIGKRCKAWTTLHYTTKPRCLDTNATVHRCASRVVISKSPP